MLSLWITIKVFIKGMIMGAVNVFPVSSGTVSLILGVFERFVNSIKSLNPKNFRYLRKGQASEFARRTDFKFFLTIVLGLFTGMILTAIFLKQSLKTYEVYTWSFFIGLIIASVVYVMKRIEKVNIKNILLVLAGFAINYELIVTEAIPALTKASTFMHGARILFPFALGSVVSIVSFSYLLSWLMRDFRNETLSALAGFMLGSLPVVYPWKEPTADMMDFAFHLPQWNSELLMAVVMMVLGAATVYLLELMARHTARKQAERLLNPKPKRHGKKTQ